MLAHGSVPTQGGSQRCLHGNPPVRSPSSTRSPRASHIGKPSGDRIMLLDPKAPLKEGDLVKLTLTFAGAGPLEFKPAVEPPGAMGPHEIDHQPGTENDHEDQAEVHHHQCCQGEKRLVHLGIKS